MKKARFEMSGSFDSSVQEEIVFFEAAVPTVDISSASAIYNVSSVAALVNSPSLVGRACALLSPGGRAGGAASPSELILAQAAAIEGVRPRKRGAAVDGGDDSNQRDFRRNLEVN
jgi:hypothetical protein